MRLGKIDKSIETMHISIKLLIYLYNSKKYLVINNLNIETIEKYRKIQ